MFEPKYEKRLASWAEFREKLETDEEPFRCLLDKYKEAPSVSLNADPWDKTTWPNPWELIHLNEYCYFTSVLGYCYSLQLTERFKDSDFEIHIFVDDNKGYVYMLSVDDLFLGYNHDACKREDLPNNLKPHQTYPMPALQ